MVISLSLSNGRLEAQGFRRIGKSVLGPVCGIASWPSHSGDIILTVGATVLSILDWLRQPSLLVLWKVGSNPFQIGSGASDSPLTDRTLEIGAETFTFEESGNFSRVERSTIFQGVFCNQRK